MSSSAGKRNDSRVRSTGSKDDTHDRGLNQMNALRDAATAHFTTDGQVTDYSYLPLEKDNAGRPLWVLNDGRIILEAFSPIASQAEDFLVTIAEPITRPEHIHEYKMTPYSLYAAVSVGLESREMIETLAKLSKVPIPAEVVTFIEDCTSSFGKVKLVLKHNRYFIESRHLDILQKLLEDKVIEAARISPVERGQEAILGRKDNQAVDDKIVVLAGAAAEEPEASLSATTGLVDSEASLIANKDLETETDNDDLNSDEDILHSFEIKREDLELVRQRCNDIGYPLQEEYDFRNDTVNPNMEIDLNRRLLSGLTKKSRSAKLLEMVVRDRVSLSCLVVPVKLSLESPQLAPSKRARLSFARRLSRSINGQESFSSGRRSSRIRLPNSLRTPRNNSEATPVS